VTKDAISDNLANVDAPRPVPEHLEPRELDDLVGAAARHDTILSKLTREEKEAGLTEGKTPRFAPTLPYLAVVLLSGMRADEARCLRWERVDLDAAPAGKITLRPEDVKTKIGRTIDLSVSPLLRTLLRTMKLKAGDATFAFGDLILEDEKTKEKTLVPALTPGEVKAAYKRLP
jgi:integrase